MVLLLTLLACSDEPLAPACEGLEPLPRPTLAFEGDAPTNLIMISLDTLRRDRVGRYDPSGASLTPALDGLLASGLTLDDHRACSNWTYPSMLCALSGQDTLSLGFLPITNLGEELVMIPQEIELMAQWLGDAGYQTAAVSANPVFSNRFGMDRGYDRFTISTSASAQNITSWSLDLARDLVDAGEPWFLHAHYIDPHVPYDPPDAYLSALEGLEPVSWDLSTKKGISEVNDELDDLSDADRALVEAHVRARYDGEVAYLDDQIAVLMSGLETRGALDDALVVVWSDHGEQLWDHGGLYHHEDLYSEETAAVAAFIAPGLAAETWTQPSGHADLAPTIFEALGVARAFPESDRCARFSEALDDDGGAQSVDSEGWRMIYDWSGDVELYDRAADPTESNDLFDRDHPEVQRLWDLLAPRIETMDALHDGARPRGGL